MTKTLTRDDIIQMLDAILDDLNAGPGTDRIRAERTRIALGQMRSRLLQNQPPVRVVPPEEDSLSRVALLFTALITSDSLLAEAARDVLPPRPYTTTIRTHIENWLREPAEGKS